MSPRLIFCVQTTTLPSLAHSYSFLFLQHIDFSKSVRSCISIISSKEGTAESTTILDVRIVRECFHRLIMNYLIIGTLFNGADSQDRSGGRAWGTAEACLSSSLCHIVCVCMWRCVTILSDCVCTALTENTFANLEANWTGNYSIMNCDGYDSGALHHRVYFMCDDSLLRIVTSCFWCVCAKIHSFRYLIGSFAMPVFNLIQYFWVSCSSS